MKIILRSLIFVYSLLAYLEMSTLISADFKMHSLTEI